MDWISEMKRKEAINNIKQRISIGNEATDDTYRGLEGKTACVVGTSYPSPIWVQAFLEEKGRMNVYYENSLEGAVDLSESTGKTVDLIVVAGNYEISDKILSNINQYSDLGTFPVVIYDLNPDENKEFYNKIKRIFPKFSVHSEKGYAKLLDKVSDVLDIN